MSKKCTKCGVEKEAHEYYACKYTRDKLQSWCKACTKNKKPPSAEAGSTAIARRLLERQGIPCCIGRSVGQSYVDLMAWACVPIEAKASKKTKQGNYHWTFTIRQKEKALEGFVVLIALDNSSERVFVVPCESEFMRRYYHKKGKQFAITAAIESTHHNATIWQYLKQYEDAYYHIEEARQRYSKELVSKGKKK
jgi:hypothetical protein